MQIESSSSASQKNFPKIRFAVRRTYIIKARISITLQIVIELQLQTKCGWVTRLANENGTVFILKSVDSNMGTNI